MTHDYLVEIKVNTATAQMVSRKAGKLNISEDVIVNFCGQMLLSQFKARSLPTATKKGGLKIGNAGGPEFRTLPISRELCKELTPYTTALEVNISSVMQDAINAMRPNIQRLLPINARALPSIHKQLFQYEQKGESLRPQ